MQKAAHILTVGHLRSVGIDPTDLAARLGSAVTTVRDHRRAPSLARVLRPSAVLVEFTTLAASQALCSSLRAVTDAHLSVITRREEPGVVQALLDAGVDQVVHAAAAQAGLVEAVRSGMTRGLSGEVADAREYSGLAIDYAGRTVTLDGRPVELTRTEFDILEALTLHPRVVITRSQLLNLVWEEGWSRQDHVIDVTIGRLRAKLGESGSRPRYLETVRGVGFRFNPSPETGDEGPTSDPEAPSPVCEVVVGNSADVLARYAPDGTLLWVSPSVTAHLGWLPGELVGSVLPMLEAEFVPTVRGMFEAASLAGTRSFSARVRVRSAGSGSRWTENRYSTVWTPTGELDSIVAVIRPVDDQVRREQELEAAQLLFKSIAEASADVAIRADNQGILEWVSPSVRQMLGWPSKVMTSRPFIDFVHRDDVARIRQVQARLLEGQDQQVRVRLRTSTGGYRLIDADVRPVRDDAGIVIGRIAKWRAVADGSAGEQDADEDRARAG